VDRVVIDGCVRISSDHPLVDDENARPKHDPDLEFSHVDLKSTAG